MPVECCKRDLRTGQVSWGKRMFLTRLEDSQARRWMMTRSSFCRCVPGISKGDD